jgi:hypothetical protein
MDGLDSSAKKLGQSLKTAFTVTAVVAGVRAIGRAMSDVVNAYAQQEMAERKLQQAISNNPMLDGSAQDRLQGFAAQLQQVTTIGDETSIELMSMAAAWGRNEDEIKTLTVAAADLSAGLGIDLVTAARGINNAMEGNVTTLTRYIPALRDLTDEQIANGDAMEIINEQFGGMARAMRDTTEGAMTNFSNAWGDLKELLGQQLAPIFTSTLSFLTDLVNGMADFITRMNELKEAREAITAGNATSDDYITVLNRDLEVANSRLREQEELARRAAAAGAAVDLGQSPVYQQLLADRARIIAELQARALESANARGIGATVAPEPTGPPAKVMQDITKAMRKAMENAFDDVAKAAEVLLEPVGDKFSKLGEEAEEVTELFKKETRARKESVENLQKGFEKLDERIKGVSEDALPAFRDALRDNTPQGAGAGPGGPFSTISATLADDLLGSFTGPLMAVANQIGYISALLDPFTQIMTGFVNVVGGMYDMFAPFVGILMLFGQVLGSVLLPLMQITAAAFKMIAELFVWAYNNVFRHIFNVLIGAANVVQMAFWGLMQAVVNIVNAVLPKRWEISNPMGSQPRSLTDGMLEATSVDALSAGANANGISGYEGPGAAAQYTTGRNITINQEINVQHLVGTDGFREFAVMVRDEILEVERMGV